MATATSIATAPEKVFNFNLGVLGHIDSGKTSLAKALSTTASTASFDKNPQSRERGITLDLGFSSFSVPIPSHLEGKGYSTLQFTLVDCPGHASLIKTIIGGAQIIDTMILVVDIMKGIQTQTAECLIIGEITCSKLVVVLNKLDLVEESKREKHITKMKNGLSKTLQNTRFAGSPIVTVSARPGGPEASDEEKPVGIQELIEVLSANAFLPKRNDSGPFIYSVDHCFPVKGHGTVMTGTVLSGSVKISDMIEIPALKVTKKVKSMQMFKKPVQRVSQGDRVGICVTQFDSKLLERGLICSPGHLPTLYGAIAKVEKIPYHKQACTTGAKFHITMGHETVMAKAVFFGQPSDVQQQEEEHRGFRYELEFPYLDELATLPREKEGKGKESEKMSVAQGGGVHQGPMATENIMRLAHHWVLLEFDHPITCTASAIVIGSRLDFDAFSNNCRIAFHGILVESITDKDYQKNLLPKIKVFKLKKKEGTVERMQDERTLIGKNLFKKETKIDLFTGMKVVLSTGEIGTLTGSFGSSGKYKIYIPDGISPETSEILSQGKKRKDDESTAVCKDGPIKVTINFKRYVFDPEKKMSQSGI